MFESLSEPAVFTNLDKVILIICIGGTWINSIISLCCVK